MFKFVFELHRIANSLGCLLTLANAEADNLAKERRESLDKMSEFEGIVRTVVENQRQIIGEYRRHIETCEVAHRTLGAEIARQAQKRVKR